MNRPQDTTTSSKGKFDGPPAKLDAQFVFLEKDQSKNQESSHTRNELHSAAVQNEGIATQNGEQIHIQQNLAAHQNETNLEEGSEDEEAEDERFWNVNMACIIAWKSNVNGNIFHHTPSAENKESVLKSCSNSLANHILGLVSLQIFRFLPLLIVLAEVTILISILDEGCKIGYLISGDSTFQMPAFNWPEHPESFRCDAAALLHDWLQEPDESVGEAPACVLYAGHLANITAVLRFDAPDFLAAYANASQGVDFGDSLEWVQARSTLSEYMIYIIYYFYKLLFLSTRFVVLTSETA